MTQIQEITRIGPYFVGEVPRDLVITFQDENGSTLNLTGYTPTTRMEIVGQTGYTLVNGSAAVFDADQGQMSYQWATGDLPVAGLYRLQMWVASGSVRYASKIFEFIVYNETEAP